MSSHTWASPAAHVRRQSLTLSIEAGLSPSRGNSLEHVDMKLFRLGMIAAMAAAFMGQQALAADPAFKVDPKVHEQSMKDAPALVQAAGLPNCTVSDAY